MTIYTINGMSFEFLTPAIIYCFKNMIDPSLIKLERKDNENT